MELTNREYLQFIIQNNLKYKNYLSYDYTKFIEEILPYSKKLRSVKMFELNKKSEEIEFIKKYDITKLTSNEFLSNIITIYNKNPYHIKFAKQILDFFFYGELQTQLCIITPEKSNLNDNIKKIIYFENPVTIREVIRQNYSKYKILPQYLNNKQINNRIKKNSNIFKKSYKKNESVPINYNLMCYSYLPKLILNLKISNTKGLDAIINLIEGQYSKIHQSKRIKTKYKRNNNYNYDLKENFVRKMENYKSYYGYEKKPKWPYNLSKMMGHSITNRERKKRYYFDGETKFLRIPHRNNLRYKKKYRKKNKM